MSDNFSEIMKRENLPLCDGMHSHPDTIKKIRERRFDENELCDLSELFKIFGDSTRIRILCTLALGEMCVCDLADALGMTVSAVSHQLAILRRAKLAAARREGKTVFYSLADEHVVLILEKGLEHIRE